MRIGTRRSMLALAQAELVAEQLGDCEILPILTSGDRGEQPDDKSRWVRELEEALLREEIDLAVHSAKDVPGQLADGLSLLGAPARAGVEDALCGVSSLDVLNPGARVGTSSLRRTAQLRCAREDLDIVPMRGNVDTRLRKLAAGEFDAIVLARAGLQRLGRQDAIGAVLDLESFVPAPGQGTLALQGRTEDSSVRAAVLTISDPRSFACLIAERAVARELSASCHTPLGAHAWCSDRTSVEREAALGLRAWLGLPDGSAWASDELVGRLADPEMLGRDLAGRLKLAGAGEMLEHAQEMSTLAGG